MEECYKGQVYNNLILKYMLRRIFQMQNDYLQGDQQGICTVSSLQWAKRCLQLGRGIGTFDELLLSVHQMNALMAVWRNYDNNPVRQTEGMGLRVVGGDRAVNQIIDVQRFVNLTAPHICIFWNRHHTMGYRCSTVRSRECEYFDIEDGLWLGDNDLEIRHHILQTFQNGHYEPIIGMRIVQL